MTSLIVFLQNNLKNYVLSEFILHQNLLESRYFVHVLKSFLNTQISTTERFYINMCCKWNDLSAQQHKVCITLTLFFPIFINLLVPTADRMFPHLLATVKHSDETLHLSVYIHLQIQLCKLNIQEQSSTAGGWRKSSLGEEGDSKKTTIERKKHEAVKI